MPSGKDVSKTEGMTPRERLAAALRCQPLDRVPWTVDLAYYNHAMQEQGKFPARYDGVDGFLRQHEELGVDPYFYYPCFWAYEDVYEGAKKETHQSTNETIHCYTLNGNTLTFTLRYMPDSYCWAHFKYPVTTTEDLELFLKILRARRMVPALERHRQMQEEWGERGLLCIGAPRTPIPEIISEWCGLTATAMLSFDVPDLFEEVLVEMDHVADPIFDAIADFRPVAVHFPDNISSENIGSFWDRYMLPVYRRRLKQMHDAGIVCAIHNDGTMRSSLSRIAGVGFDAAEALTPAPVGDVAVEEMRNLAGREDFILWGLVPGAAFCPAWSETQFRECVSKVLKEVKGPFIMGSADQVPPDGDISRVGIVSDMLAERQRAEGC